MKRNFEHLIQETRPQTCGRMVFKFKKKQTKSENHEICQDLMISYEVAVVKIEQVSHKSVMYDVYKPKYLTRRIIALRRIR